MSEKGLTVPNHFSTPGTHPFDQMKWENRLVRIVNSEGKVVFEQNGVESPKSWSPLATRVAASKYFYGSHKKGFRENSVKQIIHRVCNFITNCGREQGYFADTEDYETFYNELAWLCLNQYGSFNSPVWFNVGLTGAYGIVGKEYGYYWDRQSEQVVPCTSNCLCPQVSACFIQSVKDSMEDIMRLATSEAMLFKYGSGTGTNLSTLRSSKEELSSGNTPSGPLGFMRIFDQIAAITLSGGKTRRAAKMQSMDVSHPDIVDFILAKAKEEEKARLLISSGYDKDKAYESLMYQNSNLSVRVTDEFMRAVETNAKWTTRSVTANQVISEYPARELMALIAESTRVCGDPGLQYHDTINKWHTCPNSGPINSSNPCSEYMFVDDSACNLASLNLMKFMRIDGSFNLESFQSAIRIFIIAQDILVDSSSYPEAKICENSHKFRPLGLGFANLGGLIMSQALPYDSEGARDLAAYISKVMTATAYEVSAEIASVKGPFDEFEKNKSDMLKVIEMHGINLECENPTFRNAQVTLVAPTGTIGFMMDCDTTGIEPELALVKYKSMTDSEPIEIINKVVPVTLQRMGYGVEDTKSICEYISRTGTIEGAPNLDPNHLPVFDCAFKARNGKRCIHYMAHLKMMAAVQPFISGAISKTINMPKESTSEEISAAYMEGWKLGLKAVAIYRDGSKGLQPLSTKKRGGKIPAENVHHDRPYRRRLPNTRHSLTHKFSVAGHEGYLTVGLYEDGQPGELFITMAKEGSTIGGLMDIIGTCTSMALQYGVPLATLVNKFRHTQFEPSGMTDDKDIPFTKSLIDYIFCWIGCKFISGYTDKNIVKREIKETKLNNTKDLDSVIIPRLGSREKTTEEPGDGPACTVCGAITVRNGTCYKCYNCGQSMGCS